MKDQEIKVKLPHLRLTSAIRIFASLVICLGGLILFADKVFNFDFSNNFGFLSSKTLVWVISQTASPLIIILGAILRPYKISYLVPVYIYLIQLFWVFSPDLLFDDVLLQTYAIGSTIAFVLLVILINYVFRKAVKAQNERTSFLEQALDLSISIQRKTKN